MSSSAYIRLVPESNKESITIQEVKDLLTYYQEITTKSGAQLEWEYNESAFPYDIKDPKEGSDFFGLVSKNERYKNILIGVSSEEVTHNGESVHLPYIQISLPENASYGDKGKANEFSKFLATKLKGKLELFNGRIMYFYDRK